MTHGMDSLAHTYFILHARLSRLARTCARAVHTQAFVPVVHGEGGQEGLQEGCGSEIEYVRCLRLAN